MIDPAIAEGRISVSLQRVDPLLAMFGILPAFGVGLVHGLRRLAKRRHHLSGAALLCKRIAVVAGDGAILPRFFPGLGEGHHLQAAEPDVAALALDDSG